MSRSWKVGKLAKETGVTVRALHHYDQIGLLTPSDRTGSGYRLYTSDDVARLQQILSLRQLGFSLEEIGSYLASPDASPLKVVELHLAKLRGHLEAQHRLIQRLESLANHLRSSRTVSAQELIETLEMMTMFEKYYTPEQLEELEQRRLAVGEERIAQVQQEWADLHAAVQAEMDAGTDPRDERVKALAVKWNGLVREFTGGNPQIARSLKTMYEKEPVVAGMDTGPMREMRDYITRAMQDG